MLSRGEKSTDKERDTLQFKRQYNDRERGTERKTKYFTKLNLLEILEFKLIFIFCDQPFRKDFFKKLLLFYFENLFNRD